MKRDGRSTDPSRSRDWEVHPLRPVKIFCYKSSKKRELSNQGDKKRRMRD